MNTVRVFAIVSLLAGLSFGTASAQQSPAQLSNSAAAQAARDEVAAAVLREQLDEQRRILSRRVPEDVRAMVRRESARARSSIAVFLITCLSLFCFFVLPLFERDKVVPDQMDRGGPRSNPV